MGLEFPSSVPAEAVVEALTASGFNADQINITKGQSVLAAAAGCMLGCLPLG